MNIVIYYCNDYVIHCSTSNRRVSMAYAAGTLLHTLSTSPNTVFITPSNFSSFSSTDYRLATGRYNISTVSGDVNIRSIFVNQTSQQFLPGEQSSSCIMY